eukprot:520392_1
MAYQVFEVFEEKRQCEISQQGVLKCQAINRIRTILHGFNDNPLHKDPHENESNLMNKFALIFIDNHYTNTSLLNDFHHIKYAHHADDNDDAFSKIHEYLIDGIDTVCNEKQCMFITRYFRERSILQHKCILNDETNDNDRYNSHDHHSMMELISRIHVYFIHSYDLNRFTMHELRSVNEQTEDHNLDDDALEDMRVRLLIDIVKTIHDAIAIKQNNNKFKEPMSIVKEKNKKSVIDYTKKK